MHSSETLSDECSRIRKMSSQGPVLVLPAISIPIRTEFILGVLFPSVHHYCLHDVLRRLLELS